MLTKVALAFFIFTQRIWAADFEPPAYSRPVVDQARLMSESVAQNMSVGLEKLWREGGSQIAVLTIDSLGGIPIESASIKTVEKWKLGSEKQDNGVLLMIAKSDRTMRIEVGQGLEGVLTDLYSKRIIEDVIVPRFKSGEFEQGIIEGVVTIMKYTDPDKNLSGLAGSEFPSGRRSDLEKLPFLAVLLSFVFQHPLIFFFILFILLRMLGGGRRRGRHSGWSSSGWGGGGFGGGSFGGGGFGGFSGGGGGGFSGGGASGRW